MEINPFFYFLDPNRRVYWLFIISSLIIGLIYLWLNPKTRKVNFSSKLWLHPSAVLDYVYFVFSSIIKIVLIVPIVIGATEVTFFVNNWLINQFGWIRIRSFSYTEIMILFTLSLFIFSDLTRYLLHRLLHSIPILWEFHKVHHSAKVLNPFTFYRVHPLENLLFGLRYSLTVGLVTGIFLYFFGARLGLIDIVGVNAIGFIFALIGSNLRHSHIHLSYPRFVEKLFISPYQHQIHHSKLHNNRNYGGFLAIWDLIFGSLTHSKQVKFIKLGIERAEMKNFAKFYQLLFYPFISILKKL